VVIVSAAFIKGDSFRVQLHSCAGLSFIFVSSAVNDWVIFSDIEVIIVHNQY
jgi:hypothetical protein